MPARLWIAVPLVFASALCAASGQADLASPPKEKGEHCVPKSQLSSLDFLALASMADSQRPLAMAAYRPQRQALPPQQAAGRD
jgi:hypothetical protein